MILETIPKDVEDATLAGHTEFADESKLHRISTRNEHVFGLDALRFFAALWVVFSHLGPVPVFAEVDRSHPIGFVLHGAWGVLHSGPAAVIVFFVISGFCIHYPYTGGAAFRCIPYLIRRYVRIGIPMAAAMILTELADIDSLKFFDAILWSLVAELMYYTSYPLIRLLKDRLGMDAIVAGAFVLSLAVVLTDPAAKGYGVYGWRLNWLLGLPCWLLGVSLAETWQRRTVAALSGETKDSVWKWRTLVWASSSMCLALNFHSPIGYPWTLNLFAIIAYAWIVREIRRANGSKRPWRALEWAGGWSYSLYLCHMFATRLYSRLGASLEAGPILDWFLRIAFVLGTSYAFYLLVELPAHSLARRLARVRGLNPLRA
ncbi:MAG: acyltransferase [Burkholderiales bacterium]|nr:acyltransferase [Burkholderiales bacterium]